MQADKLPEAGPATDYDELAAQINQDDHYVIGAVIRLHQMQTDSERRQGVTKELNGVGFNGLDAPILSSFAEFYNSKGFLTPKQIAFARGAVKKYIHQLLAIGCFPASIKEFSPAPVPQATMTAALLVDKTGGKPTGIQVKFNFPKGDNRFGEVLGKVKTLPDRRWVAEQKYWKVGLSVEAGKSLKDWGFQFSEGLQKWYDELFTTPATEIGEIEIPGLKLPLYPFQRQGVAFIESRNGKALIGDEMGLGKTAQALAWLQLHPEKRPAIVVCPASLKLNWAKEIRIWMPSPQKVQIVSGKKNGYALIGDIIIINYDILDAWLGAITAYNPSVVIFDEIHYGKNADTIRTKAMKKLAKIAPHVIGLSGTPIVNRAIEFFNPINMIRQDLFPSYWRFAHEYTNARNNGFGWEFKGSRNADKLHKILTETIMVRRRKEDVLPELPPKTYTVIPFEIDNRGEYQEAANDIVAWIAENEGRIPAERASRARVLVEFEKLKQLAVRGKMASAIDWISDFLESGQKLVVFATHTETLNLLQEKFGDVSVRRDGTMNQADKQKAVDRFQNDDSVRLFLGNVKAAGVGITLTAASNVAFMELPWTPGDLVQAEDRCHRIGQADNVTVWYLTALGTVDETVAAILSEKTKTLDAVLDGKDTDQDSILTALINSVK